MVVSTQLDATFWILYGLTNLAGLLTGSTLHWVVQKGLFKKYSHYNLIVTIAAVSSLIETVGNFSNMLMSPNYNYVFTVIIVINWVAMTHSSVLLVSRRLSYTELQSEKAWRKLLSVNYVMLPVSIIVSAAWILEYKCDHVPNHNLNPEVVRKVNRIFEPIQIALWGLIELCLSGVFVAKMWKFHWTPVQRKGILVLVMVAFCDIMAIVFSLLIQDLPSKCIKGFIYVVRIRLEISVLDSMVAFLKSKRNIVSHGTSTVSNTSKWRWASFWTPSKAGKSFVTVARERNETTDIIAAEEKPDSAAMDEEQGDGGENTPTGSVELHKANISAE